VASLPRALLHVEGGVLLVASVYLYARFGMGWLWFAALILAPDLSMIGYVAGPRVGAWCYDAVHTTVGPAALALLMLVGLVPVAWGVPLVWLAHVGGDRLLGFGLKYPTSFQDTHLQRV